MDYIMPTPERMKKGDLDDYVGTAGVPQARSKLRTLEYHNQLFKDNKLTPCQHQACEDIIDLHHKVFAGMGYRSILQLMMRRTEGVRTGQAEAKLSVEDLYYSVMGTLIYHQRVVVAGLLFDGLSTQKVARHAFIGKKRVSDVFIEAADRMAKKFSEQDIYFTRTASVQ